MFRKELRMIMLFNWIVIVRASSINNLPQPVAITLSFKYLPIKTHLYFNIGIESLSKITSKILEFQTKYNSNITKEELITS